MIPFNYHHLYYFFVVAREGSIVRACEKLRLAQPTVSMQLKQFEASLGRELFERRKKRLHLTDDGRTVLDYAQSIFDLGSELQDTLRDQPAGGRPSIQIGVAAGTPWAFTHALLRTLLDHEPEAHISVRQGSPPSLREALLEQRLDLVLSDAPAAAEAAVPLRSRLVARVPIVLAACPALAAKYGGRQTSLRNAPFILPATPVQVYGQVLQFLADRDIQVRVLAEVQDVETARRLAISGYGIAPLNMYTVTASAPAHGLVVLKTRLPADIAEPVYIIRGERKRPNRLAEFADRAFRIPGASGGSTGKRHGANRSRRDKHRS